MDRTLSKANRGLDLGKFICAVLVIMIHTTPFAWNIWLDRGAGIMTRFAVPFFFVTTGYFFYNGQYDVEKLKHSLSRLIILYVIWSLIYLPFNWPLRNPIQSVFITGISGHLWYLPAVIFALIGTFFLNKYLGINLTLSVAYVFLVLGTMFSTYEPITSKVVGGALAL